VRYVGEPVAAVFAEDSYVAEDAAELVNVDIEDLPPVLDARSEPGEFSPGRDTEADVLRQGYGDVDAVFAHAHTIVELDLTSGRHSGVPL
jgi:carbon-monoxide dehydrogenase large subunit/6-hydroxypseudooxynicotine dehydrogenase subunit gamma